MFFSCHLQSLMLWEWNRDQRQSPGSSELCVPPSPRVALWDTGNSVALGRDSRLVDGLEELLPLQGDTGADGIGLAQLLLLLRPRFGGELGGTQRERGLSITMGTVFPWETPPFPSTPSGPSPLCPLQQWWGQPWEQWDKEQRLHVLPPSSAPASRDWVCQWDVLSRSITNSSTADTPSLQLPAFPIQGSTASPPAVSTRRHRCQ